MMVTIFKRGTHEVDWAGDGETAMRLLRERHYDVVLADYMLPGTNGMAVLREAKKHDPSTEVIVVTAHGTLQNVDLALKLGAFDYILKPFEVTEIEMRVEKAFQQGRMRHELAYLRHQRDLIYRISDVVGVSPAMAEVRAKVAGIAPGNTPVLITGEGGTGRRLIAGTIHYGSPRSNANFIVFPCSAFGEKTVEVELFGREGDGSGPESRRTGRVEQADAGTLFLSDVTYLPIPVQEMLLATAQKSQIIRKGGNRPVTVQTRFIASTDADPEAEVKAGRLLPAFATFLSGARIHMPPLKDRREDVIPLAEFFLRRLRAELNRPLQGFTDRAKRAMQDYDWPGNIRELRNTLERAAITGKGDLLDEPDLSLGKEGVFPLPIGPDGMGLKDLEKEAVLEALRKTDYVQKDAAVLLGISKRAMHYKVTQFGIKHPRWLKNK